MMMNWFDPPNGIVQRVVVRTGVEHPHADLDPKRTALVVVMYCKMARWPLPSALA